MESAQDKLFSKLQHHQNEMMANYGFASPVVSAAILVGPRCVYAIINYIILNQYAALTQRSPGWGLLS